MPAATATLHPAFAIGAIDKRLYGGFVEHLGRAVYGGIYEPGHATADGQGWRRDVLDLVRELDMPITRYPGGNFVSGYDWEDGVGPRDQRPRRLDLAWHTVESNQVGTNEFIDWCRLANTDPMIAVNLGTRGPDAARRLAEYCNVAGGTALSDLRRKHGWEKPHNVKLWCLGNEMDGEWQMGHKSPQRYGEDCGDAARMLKWLDPANEVVVCGSSHPTMGSFGQWELDVLDRCLPHTDYLSLHQYVNPNASPDRMDYLALADEMDAYIRRAVAICDAATAKRKAKNRVNLSFDEWNVWQWREENQIPKWTEARPILQDTYSVLDAVMVGSMLISLLNNADRVKIACIAQTVNVIAPIRTEPNGPAWRQTTFHPFALTSRHGRGTTLRMECASPRLRTGKGGEIPALHAAAVHNPDGGVSLFAVNRHPDQPIELDVALPGSAATGAVEHQCIAAGADPLAVNAPGVDRAVPVKREGAAMAKGQLRATLPPLSWSLLRVAAPW